MASAHCRLSSFQTFRRLGAVPYEYALEFAMSDGCLRRTTGGHPGLLEEDIVTVFDALQVGQIR